MLKMFLKRGKGSISVFVTVIMVPVVFFTGFLVDLTRIKFNGNQAVMAADNYGEAILTDYDNLLKELYGLFALTQNKEGTEALDRLDSYVKEYYLTSFKPNDSRISFGHLEDFLATDAYEGWMPYQNAVVALEAVPVEGASLSDPAIFNTQIGDFMKFRILQTLGDDEDSFLNAIEEIQNMGNNIKAVDKRNEITDKATEVLADAQDYYVRLEALWQYPDYIKKIDDVYKNEKESMEAMIQGDYTYYKAYMDEDPQAIAEALEHREEIEEQEAEKETLEAAGKFAEAALITVDTLSAEEERLCEIDDDYAEHLGHSPQPLQKVFDDAVKNLTERIEWEKELKTGYDGGTSVTDHKGNTDKTVNFSNFDQKSAELQDLAGKLEKEMKELEYLRSELDSILNSENITQELKDGMEEEMKELDALFGGEKGYSADIYVQLASHIASFSGQNSDYKQQADKMLESMKERGGECIASYPEVSALPPYEEELDQSRISGFRGGSFIEPYNNLKQCFGMEGSGSKKEAEKKQDAAEGLLSQVGDALDKEETTAGVRDIPSGGDFAGMGDSGTAGGFNLMDMMGSAAKNFESNSLADIGNSLLTKVYLIQYDFGMFTSRVTNVENSGGGEEGETKGEESVQLSLTGYPMAPNINYLYQAEIEYLLGGHNSSKENLNEARNKILSFRAVMNLASTYTVEPINDAIKVISEPFAAVPTVGPVLKVAVAAALRMAVAGVETYADWQLLKTGKSVCVLKREMGDLSIMALPGEFSDGLNSLLGTDIKKDGAGSSNDFKLNYEQYLTIMLIFLTRSEILTQRSSDLITLNVNAVKQKIGSGGQLSSLTFKMEDTVTAVDVTCAVQLDMVVMPKGFAKRTVDDETYAAIEQFEDNTYKFTVTRGY